jgi:SAM-dependent methyltransferase
MTKSIQAVDDLRTFDAWARDYYEPLALQYYDMAIARMLGLLAVGKGGLILDAGCGTGVHSVRAAKAGYRIQAVDISEVVLDVAQQHAQEAGVSDRISFAKANLTRLSFPNEHFDAIFSWGVVIHVPEIETALAELCRVLKTGGRLALQITNSRSIDYLLERLARSVLRKPDSSLTWSRFGAGSWCEMNGGRLFNWHLDIPALSRYLESALPLRRTYRGAAEFTELHRRLSWPVFRDAFRQINRFYFSVGLPAGIANTNLLVFEKRSTI